MCAPVARCRVGRAEVRDGCGRRAGWGLSLDGKDEGSRVYFLIVWNPKLLNDYGLEELLVYPPPPHNTTFICNVLLANIP